MAKSYNENFKKVCATCRRKCSKKINANQLKYSKELFVKNNDSIFKSFFIGLRSSKNYYKRPGGVAGAYGKGHLGVNFLCGSMCAEGMGCESR